MEEVKTCPEPHSPILGESCPACGLKKPAARADDFEVLRNAVHAVQLDTPRADVTTIRLALPGVAHLTPRILVFRSPFDARRVDITPDILEDPKDKKTREAKRNRKWKYMETTRKYK